MDKSGHEPLTLTSSQETALAVACGLLLLGGLAARGAGASEAAIHLWQGMALAVGSVAPVLSTVPSLLARRVDIDLLMLLAGFGAALLGNVGEGAVLMFLFSGSGALEQYTSQKTRRSIEALKEHLEQVAVRLLPGGASQEVAVEQLAVGDLVLVRPGARIAADGKVISGESSVDQAALTGESLPVLKQPGDEVMAGSVNLNEGALVVEVSRPASDCTLARMIRLVDEAQHNRAHTQVFTDWFGEHYTRFVILATIVSYFAFRSLGLEGQDGALYRAMTLLVVASPCALVLATPAAILAAIASAARHGVLVKGGGCFEDIAAVRVVTFDKTGTLTSGRPRLERLIPLNGVSPDELLRLAASAERNSEHPVATAIVEAARQRGLELVEPAEFRAITGRGVIAQVGEQRVIVGSPQLFCQEGFKVPGCPAPECLHRDLEGCRGLVVGTPEPVGRLDVLDSLRDDAPAAVSGLKAAGIGQVAMLTGDNAAAARAVAQAAGVDEVHANLLPAEKLDRLRELRERHGKVMMVGDGVNDAPALAAADVGVAMGGIGSDVALETADVVLTTDDLSRLPFLVALSRRTTRTVAQNLAVAIAVILVMGSLVLFTDGVKLPLAVVAHEGGTVLVILNGLRLLRD